MTVTLSIIKTYVWLYSFLSILQICFLRKSSFQIQKNHEVLKSFHSTRFSLSKYVTRIEKSPVFDEKNPPEVE